MKSCRRNSSQSRISCVCGHRAVPYISSVATMQSLQSLSHHVIDGCLHFLNARDVVAVHDEREFRQPPAKDFSTVVTKKGDRKHISFACLFQSHNDVARTATRRDSNRNIFRSGLGNQLTQEDDLSTNV